MKNSNNLRWYAAYTKSRNEKKVLPRLTEKGIEAFLPLQRKRKKWSDRLKWVEEPLIPSYIFVKVDEARYYDAINTEGMVRYVTFEGKAAPIPDWQMDALKLLLMQDVELEISKQSFTPGQKIIVKAGVMMGMQGEVVESVGRKRMLVRLGDTGLNLLITLPAELIENA